MITEISISHDFTLSKEKATTFDYLDEVYKQKVYTSNDDFLVQQLMKNLKYGLLGSFDNPLFPKDMFAIRIKFSNDKKISKLPMLFTMADYVELKPDTSSDDVILDVPKTLDDMYAVTITTLKILSNDYVDIDLSPTFDNLEKKGITMNSGNFNELWNYIPTLLKNYGSGNNSTYMVILAYNRHVYSYVFSLYVENNERVFFSTIYGAED